MQIVGYETGVDRLEYTPQDGVEGEVTPASLLLADNGRIHRQPLPRGTDLEYGLDDRHCAGHIHDDSHESCDAADAPECPDHTTEWPCARCTGACDKPIPACDEEHAVYIAAFAPAHFKVGVTRLWRLPARLHEQGADHAAHVHTVSDGRIARRIERELTDTIPDRVAIDAKIDGLHQTLDHTAWHTLLDDFAVIDTIPLEYEFDLDTRPVVETLATGTVLGTKGRLLILAHAGGTYAVDLRDLVGYDITEGEPVRDIQSNLGVFD